MKTSPSKFLARLLVIGLSAAGLLATISPSAQAAANTWLTTGTQDWATAANWSGGAIPVAGDVVFVNTTAGSTYPIISAGAQVAAELWIGAFNGNPTRLDITGGSLTSSTQFIVAPDDGSVVTISQSAGTVAFTSASNSLQIARNGGDATYNMSGGTLSSVTWFNIGDSGTGGTGTFNLTGGTVNAATSSGGVNIGDQGGATGILNVSGGTFNSTNTTSNGGIVVGNHWTGSGTNNGTLTISGTGVVNTGSSTAGVGIKLASGAASVGTVNLDGGTLQTAKIQKGSGTGTFNFNGGTLQATASNAAFMTGLTNAFVKSGGAVIDTSSQDVTIDQALLTDAVSTGGGLTKSGVGTLTLGGANTYTGATTINNGTLALESTGSILSTTIAFNLTDTTAGQMTILNPGFSFNGTLSLGLAPVTASNSWTLFAGTEFDSGDLDSLSAVTSDLGSFANAGGGLWTLSNGSGNWSFNDNTAALSFSAVPEPRTQVLVIAGLFCFLIAFRRRRCA